MKQKTWIFLDAAGTLFEPAEPVAKVYAECFASHGYPVEESAWENAFGSAFATTPDPVCVAPGDGETVERQWWKDVVTHAAYAVGLDLGRELPEEIFSSLFNHYASGSAWKTFPETVSVLEEFRNKGIGLAVASNFDARLGRVLNELGIRPFFEYVTTSADVGARKPAPAILQRLLTVIGTTAETVCLAGDSETADGGAARACGIPFFHVNRPDSNLSDFALWHASGFFRE